MMEDVTAVTREPTEGLARIHRAEAHRAVVVQADDGAEGRAHARELLLVEYFGVGLRVQQHEQIVVIRGDLACLQQLELTEGLEPGHVTDRSLDQHRTAGPGFEPRRAYEMPRWSGNP
jgi:hypothetical protein